MSEYIGLQAISTAVGVTYNELWVAVRTAMVTLRISPNHSNEPYIANDDEVRAIRTRLRPNCLPQLVKNKPIGNAILVNQIPSAGNGIDSDLRALGQAVKMLEQRCENGEHKIALLRGADDNDNDNSQTEIRKKNKKRR